MAFDRKKWLAENKEVLKKKRKAWWIANREDQCKKMRSHHHALRAEILQALGGACTCCGERQQEFLTVDHVNGDGAAHRKRTNSSRTTVYADVKKEGFPSTRYQVLCWNCNVAKAKYGRCPHATDDDVRIEDVLKEDEG